MDGRRIDGAGDAHESLSRRLLPPDLIGALEGRLRRGEHVALYGPRGSGKSWVLAALHARLAQSGVPCGLSPTTASLDDITRALEQAYPAVPTAEIARRAARARLWWAADACPGVLLLGRLTDISNAMVAFLRRLHGGLIGALCAVDVDDERERLQMKAWRYGAAPMRMPLTSMPRLKRLLRSRCATLALPLPAAEIEHRLLNAARGRPDWIIRCTELERDPRYWRDRTLLVSVLCMDTEAAVRYRALDMLRPPGGPSAGAARRPG